MRQPFRPPPPHTPHALTKGAPREYGGIFVDRCRPGAEVCNPWATRPGHAGVLQLGRGRRSHTGAVELVRRPKPQGKQKRVSIVSGDHIENGAHMQWHTGHL